MSSPATAEATAFESSFSKSDSLPRGLRICHLGKFYPPAPGGMESHVQTLARAQAELGAEVRVICVNHRDDAGRDMTWKVLGRTRAEITSDDSIHLTRCGRWGNLARLDICPSVLSLLHGFNRSNTDIVHLHTPNPTMLLALAAVRPRVPLVITHHSDVVRQRVLARLQRPFEHLVYRRARRILTTSPCYASGSDLLRHYASRVEPLPLGIDLQPFLEPSPKALEAAERFKRELGTPLWLSVGRLIYYKGLKHAVAALKHVPGKYVVVGTGPLESELRAQAEGLGVADRVVWLGHATQEELVGAYHAATALWFPSVARSEGFGLVQVEALASGCPVINTAIPHSGVSWVSRHEETGLTVGVGDETAFAQAALRLHHDSNLRARFAAAGRERVVAEFSHRVMALRSLNFYAAALAEDRAAAAAVRLA